VNAIARVQKPAEPDESDPDLRLFADRVRVYPKDVRGPIRRAKWAILILCLSVYYALPWLRWDRGPGRPNQALLLDMVNERLYIFDVELWPQEIVFLSGALILGAAALFFVTSLFGRLWCGYACPQTVWTDLFMWVERHIEGDRNARIKLDARKLDFDKALRKAAKHLAWLLIAFWTGGAWIMYYVDAPTATHEFWTGAGSPQLYFFTFLFTATTYLLAGWAREQVCTYMCPWPRFQAAMFDDNTITVAYQSWRGEPRHKKTDEGQFGDCVDCRACVNVCPTGIDIRDGQQLECINCGLCVDACNAVMTTLSRPNWLITWDNLVRQNARAAGRKPPAIRIFRPRTWIYIAFLTLGCTAMAVAFATRSTFDLSVQHDRAPLFARMADGTVRNGYTVKIANKHPIARRFVLTITNLAGASLDLPEESAARMPALSLVAGPDAVTTFRVLVRGARPPGGKADMSFLAVDQSGTDKAVYNSTFLGPGE
jgi:cytochrome c oxidase accessory protein FixG